MGTTLTAAYVGENDVTIVHVGDSRCYRLRDGELERLTVDHTLVEELVRQGRLAPDEAGGHPQRSIVTRVLGPEAVVHLDAHDLPGARRRRLPALQRRPHDMVGEQQMLTVLTAEPDLRAASRAAGRPGQRGGRPRQHHGRPVPPGGRRGRRGRRGDPGDPRGRGAARRGGGRAPGRGRRQRPGAGRPGGAPAAGGPARSPARPRNRHRAGGAASRWGPSSASWPRWCSPRGPTSRPRRSTSSASDQDGFVTVYRGVPYDVLGLELYSEVYIVGRQRRPAHGTPADDGHGPRAALPRRRRRPRAAVRARQGRTQ